MNDLKHIWRALKLWKRLSKISPSMSQHCVTMSKIELIAVRIYLRADHHDGSLITNQKALPQMGRLSFVLQARRTESVIQKRK